MPTSSEKKALIFLAAVAITGAGVRATGAAARAQTADASSRDALRRQIVAVESAGASDRRKRSGTTRKSAAGQSTQNSNGAPTRRRRSADLTELAAPATEIDPRSIFAPTVVQPSARRGSRKADAPASPIDVDVASANELEGLPRIGPALAKRIVDDRSVNGPFGSLEALRRVRGVGPAMVRELTPYVTFSGTPRPSIAGEAGASAASGGTRTSRVRTGAAQERRRRRPAPP